MHSELELKLVNATKLTHYVLVCTLLYFSIRFIYISALLPWSFIF